MKLILILLLVAVSMGGFSQPKVVFKLDKPINFDGKVDSLEWAEVPVIPSMMLSPTLGAEPSEKSEVYMAYDENYLYLAGRMFHENVDDILATSFKRDIFNYANDYFGFIIDSFNDNENALSFITTPVGVRTDFVVFNDADGAIPVNSTWNSYWDVKTTQDENGWYAELRVPFSSLRFNEVDGKTIMGITYYRRLAYKNERITQPGLSNEFGPWSVFKPSQAQKYVFEGIKNKKPLYIAPYVLGGLTQNSVPNTSGDGYKMDNSSELNIGMDVKYSLSSNLTMDVTVNTDFAQVEADDQQVNLTRFSLFFPEKRLFFQERASIFSFNSDVPNTLFYSRRIGIEDGKSIPIYGGARLVGRVGKWDIGFLDMQTKSVDDLASTNYGVVRLRRQIINASSYVGAMATNKLDTEGNLNVASGIDGTLRVIGNDYFVFGLANTFTNNQQQSFLAIDQSKIYLNWQKRSIKGFGYEASFSRIGSDYNPEMGYELRRNVSNYRPKVWYGWLMNEKSWLQDHKFSFEGSLFFRNSDAHEKESEIYALEWNYHTKSGAAGTLTLTHTYDNVLHTFYLSEKDSIPAGTYQFPSFEASISSPQGRTFATTGNFHFGGYYGGKRINAGLLNLWNISSHLSTTLSYQYNNITHKERDMNFNSHLTQLKLDYSINTKISTSAFIQHNSGAKMLVANVKLRYNPREGDDLYIVYNEAKNTDRMSHTPNLPLTDNRTILIKYTRTFRL